MPGPKGNQHAKGNKGKPTSYKPSYDPIARALSRHGATNFTIARALGVSEMTIYNWRHANPSFDAACKPSDEEQLEAVRRSLFARATGYSHRSTKIVVVDKEVRRVRFTQHYPPDPACLKFFLTNKSAGEFAERQEVEQSGGVTVRVVGGLPGDEPEKSE